ncbi:MAG: hydroxyacylglutathione hydrolase [Planctomycetota bacterium]|jgi:hydroxyacylglutathione hydrolase
MIIEKSMSENWLSNTWLVADPGSKKAVIIDTGGPTAPIMKRIEELGVEVTHVLCTHHHLDHIAHNDEFKSQFGCPVCGGAQERAWFEKLNANLDIELSGGEEIVTGGLNIRTLHIPGHTSGQLAFVINDERVFTGDTLFKDSVGGTRGPDHTTFEDLHHSIMEVLMKLPKDLEVHPGHMQPTTIAQAWEENAFVRLWRGADTVKEQDCTAFGKPAKLLLRAADYDGGTKCFVRFEEGNKLDMVPGSKVTEL